MWKQRAKIYIKKYAFLLMILASGMVYGTGKVVKAAEHNREQKIAEAEQGKDKQGSGEQQGTQRFGLAGTFLATVESKAPAEKDGPGTNIAWREDSSDGSQPGEKQPGTDPSKGSQPGGSQAGSSDSGEEQPENSKLIANQPEVSQPGTGEQNNTRPGSNQPGGEGTGDNQPGGSQPENPREPQGPGKFRRVELDYLNDALFIGDSRTSTLYEYAGWEQTDFFVKYGLTIWDVWDQEMNGRKLEDMLGAKQYGKIYIMLGINELGNETAEKFREVYGEVLSKLHQLQPGAVIFLQSIIHVSARKDAEGTYINNAEVNARNREIQTLADNDTIFWLDPNEVMDEPGTGALKSDYTGDGVHLKVKYIPVWREFLLDHGI